MNYPSNEAMARFVKNGIAAQKAADRYTQICGLCGRALADHNGRMCPASTWKEKPARCGYDNRRKRLPDGRCAACGRTKYEGDLERIADTAGQLLESLNTPKEARAAKALRSALLEVGPR